jgi:hypothetical protein
MKLKDVPRLIIAAASVVYICRIGYFIFKDLKEKKPAERNFSLQRAKLDNAEETMVLEKLKLTPDQFYITSDGARLYSIFEDTLVYFRGPDFTDMSEEELGEWIAGAMSNLLFGEPF